MVNRSQRSALRLRPFAPAAVRPTSVLRERNRPRCNECRGNDDARTPHCFDEPARRFIAIELNNEAIHVRRLFHQRRHIVSIPFKSAFRLPARLTHDRREHRSPRSSPASRRASLRRAPPQRRLAESRIAVAWVTRSRVRSFTIADLLKSTFPSRSRFRPLCMVSCSPCQGVRGVLQGSFR